MSIVTQTAVNKNLRAVNIKIAILKAEAEAETESDCLVFKSSLNTASFVVA